MFLDIQPTSKVLENLLSAAASNKTKQSGAHLKYNVRETNLIRVN